MIEDNLNERLRDKIKEALKMYWDTKMMRDVEYIDSVATMSDEEFNNAFRETIRISGGFRINDFASYASKYLEKEALQEE